MSAREVGILFTGDMVRALLTGRKTQTRRVVKLPQESNLGTWESSSAGGLGVTDSHGNKVPTFPVVWHTRSGRTIAPRWRVGDTLWVRETFRAHELTDDEARADTYGVMKRLNLEEPAFGLAGVLFRADNFFRPIDDTRAAADRWIDIRGATDKMNSRWCPGIHMPRWAARIHLRVTEVRVQRVQEISDAEAIAEGIVDARTDENKATLYADEPLSAQLPHLAYRELWDSINGKTAPWASNPWVWAISFERMFYFPPGSISIEVTDPTPEE